MRKLVFLLLVFSMFLWACKDDDCKCPGEIIGKWEAEQFLSLESTGYPKKDGYEPTIEFKADGTVEIYLDKNSCFAEYELGADSSITISNTACTEMCCDSDFSEKFVEMLPSVDGYKIDGDELKLIVHGWGWIELEYVSD